MASPTFEEVKAEILASKDPVVMEIIRYLPGEYQIYFLLGNNPKFNKFKGLRPICAENLTKLLKEPVKVEYLPRIYQELESLSQEFEDAKIRKNRLDIMTYTYPQKFIEYLVIGLNEA